jgi:hypothetical protein
MEKPVNNPLKKTRRSSIHQDGKSYRRYTKFYQIPPLLPKITPLKQKLEGQQKGKTLLSDYP